MQSDGGEDASGDGVENGLLAYRQQGTGMRS